MSRSGYVDDCEDLELYRATVKRTLQGKRGQYFLKELAASMDAMEDKILISEELIDEDGHVCGIGSVCKSRGLDVSGVDPEDPDAVGKLVGISRTMAAEIEYMNDEWSYGETPEERWTRMRKWVDEQIL